jgi:hypothetical protein
MSPENKLFLGARRVREKGRKEGGKEGRREGLALECQASEGREVGGLLWFWVRTSTLGVHSRTSNDTE